MRIKIYLLSIFITFMLAMPLGIQPSYGDASMNKPSVTVQKTIPANQSAVKIPTKANSESIYKNTIKQGTESSLFFKLAIKMLKALVAVLVCIFVLFGLIKIVTGKKNLSEQNADLANGNDIDLATPKNLSLAVAKFVRKNF